MFRNKTAVKIDKKKPVKHCVIFPKFSVHDDKKSSIGCKSSRPFTAMATGENGLIKDLIQGDIYVVLCSPKNQKARARMIWIFS